MTVSRIRGKIIRTVLCCSVYYSVTCTSSDWFLLLNDLQRTGDHYVGKPSAEDQPTRPTQPFILSGSINELQLDVRHLNRWRRHLVNEVRQAWCLLQVKLCDPCLSALKWSVYHARRYTSAQLYLYGLLVKLSSQVTCCVFCRRFS